MANKKTVSKKKPSSNRKRKQRENLSYVASGIILMCVAVLFGLIVYIRENALLTSFLSRVVFALFSVTSFIIPPVLLAIGIYVFVVKRNDKLSIKIILSVIGFVIVSAIYQLFEMGFLDYSALIEYGQSFSGGGLIGGSLANLCYTVLGKIFSIIILFVLLIIIISIILKVSLISVFSGILSGIFALKDEIKEIDRKDDYESGKKAGTKIGKTAQNGKERIKKIKKNNLDFTVGDDDEDKKPKEEKKKEEQKPEQIKIDETVFKPDISLDDDIYDDNISLGTTVDDEENKIHEAEEDLKEEKKKAKAITDEEKKQISNEIEEATAEKKEYVFPPITLLNKPKAVSSDKRREMQETANKLMTILNNFGVEAKLLQVTQGPTVTRYEIQPSTGVKLSKITGLAEDIALNLAVPTVLVAAVPGKAAVGIEVPNTNVNTVSVRELLESPKFVDASSKLAVALGKDIGGNVVVGDIAKMPHVLIAGATGSGKSVCINTIITSILYKATPDEVKLLMIDPKVVELGVYNGIPHLLIPVVTDPKRAAGALNWAVGEMMKRYAFFAETGARNLSGYNAIMKKRNEATLPQIVIVIDELADLMMVAAKEVEDYVCRLAQLARAAGIHLIIATQRPSVDVITGLIKANVPSRIAFSVSSQVDSRTILDKGGAEKLLGKGDMLYHPTGLSNPLRVQGAFVSDEEIEAIVKFVVDNCSEIIHNDDINEFMERSASGDVASEESKDDGDADALLPEAINLAYELGQISTAMIQRRLKVGYSRAGRIIDQMEARGIISGPNGSKPREVYRNRMNMDDEED